MKQRGAWAILLLGHHFLTADSPIQRNTSLAFGGYQQNLSDGYGQWKGLTLEAAFNRGKGGAWIASAVTLDRPDGTGMVISGGKYLELGWGYAYLGAGTGFGASYLPRIQASADLNIALGQSGWLLGGGILRTEVRDGHRDLMVQAGPTLYFSGWVYTFRHQRNISDPGGLVSSAQTLEARHGTDDQSAWQSLGLAWGAEAYENLVVSQSVGTRGIRMTLTAFLPVKSKNGIKGTLEWGQKNGLYRYWGGSLRWVWHF